MIKIEKGIPIPDWDRKRKYPWMNMEIGDSFFVPDHAQKKALVQQQVARAGRVYNREFTTRRVEGGVRVWRVA